MNKIIIRKINKNHRGVFAAFPIKKGEIIEKCPVLILPKKDQKLIDKTFVFNYYFYWGKRNQPAIALGYGCLYNHSYQPNARYDEDLNNKLMVFTAVKEIRKGEEIRTNYNGDPDNLSPLWFKVGM